MLLRRVFWSALVLLSACQSLPVTNPASPYYQIPVGSRLVLKQSVQIPANTAHVFIQGGRVLPPRAFNPVNQYYPNCKLEVGQVKPVSQTIAPDMFVVTRVTQNWYETRRAGSVLYASLDRGLYAGVYLGVGEGDDGGPAMQNYVTSLYVHSDTQPQVYRLDCQEWQNPAEAEFLTLAQIRQALGKVMTVELAP